MKKNLAWSVVVGLAVAVAVAPPALTAAWSAWFAFEGAFMGVPADADPVAGLTLAAVLLGLLVLPVVLGRTRSALLTAHGVV